MMDDVTFERCQVLSQSLKETQRQCDSLNREMVRQSAVASWVDPEWHVAA